MLLIVCFCLVVQVVCSQVKDLTVMLCFPDLHYRGQTLIYEHYDNREPSDVQLEAMQACQTLKGLIGIVYFVVSLNKTIIVCRYF